MSEPNLWILHEEAPELDKRQAHQETIFTIGNGYLGTRGAYEERYPNEMRTTMIHGIFDEVPVVFTELANGPDWLELEVRLDGQPFRLDQGTVLSYQRTLDLRSGLHRRSVRWRSPKGQTAVLTFERFASLDDPHLVCLRLKVAPVDFSGTVEVRAGMDGSPDNDGILHWDWLGQETRAGSAWLRLRTRVSGLELGAAFRLSVRTEGGDPVPGASLQGWDVRNHPTLVAAAQASPGTALVFEKTACYFSSRESQDGVADARDKLRRLPEPAWEALWEPHARAWEKEWEACDVIIEGDDESQLAIRFNIYQLLIAASRQDETVNIGAKTLSGYGYRGHSFWDTEVYMLPFFTYTRPEIARKLLSYRWHTLPGSRRKAAAGGFKGAQIAWESAATGDEVTPTWLTHPKDRNALVRIWTGDIEIHISSDVAYAVWQYWQSTGDDAFLIERGAEVILETARFWASRLEWKADLQRYAISDVIGPDENHEHVNDNAYTNTMVRWHLRTARRLVYWLRQSDPEAAEKLLSQLGVTEDDLNVWGRLSEQIYIPYDPATRLIEQFQGYFQRKDIRIADYEPRTNSIQYILGIEGANQVQVLKQPDVMMMMYLFPQDFDEQVLRANYDYYTPRTDLSYGSSLGPSIQAIMACRVGRVDEAYENFMRAARADLVDARGNVRDGIHGASAGGLWQAVVFGFAGLKLDSQGPITQPHLPPNWRRLAFKVQYRGQPVSIDLTNPAVEASS